jgi:predicted metalloprotease with PDZ domain
MRRVSAVLDGSPAQRHRLQAGDIVLSINGEPILDEIDYQALTATRIVRMLVQGEDGRMKPLPWACALMTASSVIPRPAATTAFSALWSRCQKACANPSTSKMMIGACHC